MDFHCKKKPVLYKFPFTKDAVRFLRSCWFWLSGSISSDEGGGMVDVWLSYLKKIALLGTGGRLTIACHMKKREMLF